MDMDGSEMNSSMGDVMMVPYLHFTGGDYLLFEAWKPTSSGAIAGACIGLALLAIFDRWVAATRGSLDTYWRRRGLALVSRLSPSPSGGTSEKALFVNSDGPNPATSSIHKGTANSRTIPPFILKHDLPRGLIHAGQALLTYVLMMAVMTFNAAYIIAIIAGLGVGETLFGRMGDGRSVGH